MPVSNVSCCCLGGEELDILFITTVHKDWPMCDPEKAEPHNGSVFFCRVETKGVNESRFKDF